MGSTGLTSGASVCNLTFCTQTLVVSDTLGSVRRACHLLAIHAEASTDPAADAESVVTLPEDRFVRVLLVADGARAERARPRRVDELGALPAVTSLVVRALAFFVTKSCSSKMRRINFKSPC